MQISYMFQGEASGYNGRSLSYELSMTTREENLGLLVSSALKKGEENIFPRVAPPRIDHAGLGFVHKAVSNIPAEGLETLVS